MKKMIGTLAILLLAHASLMCDEQNQQQEKPVVKSTHKRVSKNSQETPAAIKPNTQEVILTIEEAQRLVDAWDRVETQLRAAREDTSGDAAAQGCCPSNADLAMIRACICAIKNQLCVLTALVEDISGNIGLCSDEVITAITEDDCVTEAEINAICATLQSWVKTIISELRGNQITCPPA